MSERYQVRLLETGEAGTDVIFARFEKPVGYTFVPGQHMLLRLATAEGEQTKAFTHSQAPADDYLELTTRLSGSAFKNALTALVPDDVVTITGPLGHLTLPEGTDTIAFLVGGVGITPARSMLRDAWQRGFVWKDAAVFFGNRDRSCMPYAEELAAMGSAGVRVINVLEHADEDWTGYTGFVTSQIVAENIDLAQPRIYCVSGPPVMVDAMERVLETLGVDRSSWMVERFGRW